MRDDTFSFLHHYNFSVHCSTKHSNYLFSKQNELVSSELMGYIEKISINKRRKNKESLILQGITYACVLLFFPLHPFSQVSDCCQISKMAVEVLYYKHSVQQS